MLRRWPTPLQLVPVTCWSLTQLFQGMVISSTSCFPMSPGMAGLVAAPKSAMCWLQLFQYCFNMLFILRIPPKCAAPKPVFSPQASLSLSETWCGASPRIDMVDLEKCMCDCHGSLGLLASCQVLRVRGNTEKLLCCSALQGDTEEICSFFSVPGS